MEFNSSIAKELENSIRSDPSWKLENWSRKDINELLLPLSRHVKADAVGRQRRKAALLIINNAWGPNVAHFFKNSHNEKCLQQVARFSSQPLQIRSYVDACRTVNEHVVHRLISRPSRQSGRFETTTADWFAVENALPPSDDLPQSRLI